MTEQGTYDAKVVQAYVPETTGDNDAFLCVDVTLDNGDEGTCRHRLGGDYVRIAQDVLKLLGLEWPDGLLRLDEVAEGLPVRVRVKHRSFNGKEYSNWYVVTSPPPMNKPALEKLVGRLGSVAAEGDVPF